jgi:hypothetical protein
MRTGGGVLGKVVWLLIGLAVLTLIIRYPSEAAGWVSGGFHLAGGAVSGIAAFLRNLAG